MAWVFSMWVKAETDQDQKAISDYFNGRKLKAGNKTYDVYADDSGMVTVDGISRIGIESKEDAEEMTLIGFAFYNLLKSAPAFIYAVTGVEIDGWVEPHELVNDPVYHLEFKGFVVKEKLYNKLNSGTPMQRFSEGYLWTPYEGESFNS